MTPAARGYFAIIAAASLWGISGATAKYLFAARSVDPLLLVQVRMGLSTLLLAAVLAIFSPRLLRISRADLPFLALWGTMGMAMVQFSYFFTISKTSVATAIFLQYLSPILTALYAKVVGRERLGIVVVSCLGLALCGSYLLIFGGGGQLLVTPIGLISGLLSAVFMSFYTIMGRKGVGGQLNSWTLLCWGLGLGSLFWVAVDAVLWLAGSPLETAGAFSSASMWGFYLFIAVFATIVPFGLFLIGLRSIQPTQATITGMLEPVVAGVAAFLALGEALSAAQVMGGALIVTAVCLLQYQQVNPLRKAPSAV